LNFAIHFVGDGISNTAVFDLTAVPIDAELSSFLPFDISRNVPTDVTNVSTNAGVSVLSATLDTKGKTLTVVFSAAPAPGASNGFFIAGFLVF